MLMRKIASYFEPFISEDGMPTFIFDKVDQVPFAIAAINLYKFYGKSKYKLMADYIYMQLNQWSNPQSKIIFYRMNTRLQFVDALGMVCPFLVRYGQTFNKKNAIDLAYIQIDYYLKYGIDKDSYLPAHAINQITNYKVGSTNWGRGIGWYIFALSEYKKYAGGDIISHELKEVINTLNLLKNKDMTWSQFPGSSDNF